jgi:hypothetical protein
LNQAPLDAAYRQAGATEILADVRQGTRRDAVLFSVGATRRTTCAAPTTRRAVLTLLNDEEWSKWSDREIARRCNVHHDLVGRLRPAVTGGNASEPRTFTTKHALSPRWTPARSERARPPTASMQECSPGSVTFARSRADSASWCRDDRERQNKPRWQMARQALNQAGASRASEYRARQLFQEVLIAEDWLDV